MPIHKQLHEVRYHLGKTYWTLSGLLAKEAWACDGYQRIYLYHVRKTAGTSIVFAFMRLAGPNPYLIDRKLARFAFAQSDGYRYVVSPRLIRQGRYFFAYNHLPAYAVEPPEGGTFKFTILRDPIDRVISLYRYLSAPSADACFSLKAPTEECRWASEGFDRFLDQLPSYHLSNQLHMFSRSGSVDEAVDRLGRLDMVLRTERLDRDFDRLQSVLNLRLSLSRERPSLAPFVPTDAQRSRLRHLLTLEFEMLRQIEVPSQSLCPRNWGAFCMLRGRDRLRESGRRAGGLSLDPPCK